MEKYLGNKRGLLNHIYEFVQDYCPEAKSVCDIFAGTTNTGRFFNNKGFKVLSNDINRFSYLLGKCYLGLSKPPAFSGLNLPSGYQEITSEHRNYLTRQLRKDAGMLFANSDLESFIRDNIRAIEILNYLNNLSGHRSKDKQLIKNYYTIFGKRSGFESVRGTVGKRNYFSRPNVEKLDLILEQVREWYQLGLINDEEMSLLATSIIEEVVLVANVNGTFHDFNRDKLWPNSLQKFSLKLPLYRLSNGSQFFCNDASSIIGKVPKHDLLYIDPPYNFRQYSAYYHFINFISAYAFLPDVDEYLKDIKFVRGQNMVDDFASDFCFADRFVDALQDLIDSSKSKYVVMSYYGGRNHWNHWSGEGELNDTGFQKISAVFKDHKLFKSYRAEKLSQKRQNYQSRVGEKKEKIEEYLFFGERQKYSGKVRSQKEQSLLSEPNRILKLDFFQPEYQQELVARS